MTHRVSLRWSDHDSGNVMLGIEPSDEPTQPWRQVHLDHRPGAHCWRCVVESVQQAVAAIHAKLPAKGGIVVVNGDGTVDCRWN
jgi:hypothetical protein